MEQIVKKISNLFRRFNILNKSFAVIRKMNGIIFGNFLSLQKRKNL